MSDLPANVNGKQIVESAWRDQAIWSEVANRLKASLFKWRYRASVAGVLGAFLETLAASLAKLDARWWWLRASVALAGAVALAVVPYVAKTKVSKERVSDWVRARSVSEGLKDLIYRYLLGAPPFGTEPSVEDFIQRRQRLKNRVEDLNIHAASIDPPTRARPVTLSVEEYVQGRLNGQIEGYYRPKGRQKALAAEKLHDLEFWLGFLAVIMGAAACAAAATGVTSLSVFGPWVAVVTTASAAVTAHLAASRYDHEAIIYFGTADRLADLRDTWLAHPNRMDAACVAKFVDDCEQAISTENEGWLAKWTRDPENTGGKVAPLR
jgi:hypothetical protein